MFGGVLRRFVATVVPEKGNWRQTFTRWEFKADFRSLGIAFTVKAGRLRFDARGIAELQGTEGHVRRMAGHIAQGARAVLHPPPPFERLVIRMISPLRRRADEQLPMNLG